MSEQDIQWLNDFHKIGETQDDMWLKQREHFNRAKHDAKPFDRYLELQNEHRDTDESGESEPEQPATGVG